MTSVHAIRQRLLEMTEVGSIRAMQGSDTPADRGSDLLAAIIHSASFIQVGEISALEE